jgi:predicted RNase H-like HicB family nuclease
MNRFTVELIPDDEQGGFTAHVPDIPAGNPKPKQLRI